jgi:glycine/D-amino acid oxidase-like deaminating enzyme
MGLPESAKYVIVGAGIHGLSTAYHLALELRSSSTGSDVDIIVVDKTGIGAGASGIACGVIRNNYFQPAMRELMAHSVSVWESDPEAYSYHPVGYMQISCEAMREDVASVADQQRDIGYSSTFVEGEAETSRYMREIFSDWTATGVTSVLHEKPGGYSNNRKAIDGLLAKAVALGVKVFSGVEVTGFSDDASGAIISVNTNQGNIACEQVIIGAGPWIRNLWGMLDLPELIDVRHPTGAGESTKFPMWTYWSLQEGTLGVDPKFQNTNDGHSPPVIHVDSDAPLYSDVDGSLLSDDVWGIYYKPDYNFGGVQGGAAPFIVDKVAQDVAVDPYGPESKEFIVGGDFELMWVSALAHCQKRFSGTLPLYKREPSGGIGAFTPDSFPVFDRFRDNCYVIADSNHGYKMIGVGALVAAEICSGSPSSLLQPFRFSRYASGDLHPVSNSPFPWS